MRGRIVAFLYRVWRIAHWVLPALAAMYAVAVIYAYPHDHEAHISEAMVEKIQAKKLTSADVDGQHLPPPPDPSQIDTTLAGIDANGNGIRDDAELAIFAEYPTSSATSTAVRAAELQYAMDLQIQLTDVFDTATWTAAIQVRERGFGCLYDASNTSYSDLEKEVEDIVLNTEIRQKQFQFIEQYGVAYELLSGPDCDVVRN